MSSGAPATVADVLALLEDPVFTAVWRRAQAAPLTPSDLAAMKQPAGLAPDQTWRLLTAMRRPGGVDLPPFMVDDRGRRGWYYPTLSMRRDLADIDRRCHKDSWLATAITSRDAAHFVAEAHVWGALAAVREDGATLDEVRARQLASRESTPQTPSERVFCNCLRAIRDLDDLVERPCTPELVTELHRAVSQDAPQTTPSLPVIEVGSWRPARISAEEALAEICRHVNSDDVDANDHPLPVSFGITFLFGAARPLSSWNGVMAALLTRLLFIRSRLPALAHVPIAQVHRAWRHGAIVPPHVPVRAEDSVLDTGEECDFSLWDATLVQLVHEELDATEAALRAVIARDAALAEHLRGNPRINHRQRAVLATALADSEATFRIDTHAAIHRVVRATARTDLLGLVELGYLRCVRRSRAFVFSAATKMRDVMAAAASSTPDSEHSPRAHREAPA